MGSRYCIWRDRTGRSAPDHHANILGYSGFGRCPTWALQILHRLSTSRCSDCHTPEASPRFSGSVVLLSRYFVAQGDSFVGFDPNAFELFQRGCCEQAKIVNRIPMTNFEPVRTAEAWRESNDREGDVFADVLELVDMGENCLRAEIHLDAERFSRPSARAV